MPAFSDQIAEGLKHHRAGRLAEAEAAYRQALEATPGLAEALLLLGVLTCQRGDLTAGCDLLRQAVETDPARPEGHFNLGKALAGAGKPKEAEASYRKALELNSDYTEAWNNLGNLLHLEGKQEEARDCFERALATDADHAEAAFNLSREYRDLGHLNEAEQLLKRLWEKKPNDFDVAYLLACLLRDQRKIPAAISLFERAQELRPEDKSTHYLLSVLRGENPAQPPKEYILKLFDPYASRFDKHLVHRLHYQAPEQLAKLVREKRSNPDPFKNVLDLGCGTGLSGLAFRSLSGQLTGVDLSGNMLDRARDKGVYDRIAHEELIAFLEVVSEEYDLFIATDLFIYLGDLEPLFTAVRRRCRAGGWFAFSTESVEGPDFEALPSGRYAHSMFYIQMLADAHGFRVLACRATDIREERDQGVPGHLFLLEAGPG